MNPPFVVDPGLKGERLEVFTQMVAALRTLDRIGDTNAATALCEAIDILNGSPTLTAGNEAAFGELLAQHDAYFAGVAFRRFLSNGGESKIEC